jgi:hypothetical protein
MVDLRYKEKALWRESATADEKSDVKKLDARIKALAVERQKLSQARYTITNRCTVRTLARREALNGKGD